MDGIGFFTLDSTLFWLVVIFSSFDSVFVYIGQLVLVKANIENSRDWYQFHNYLNGQN